MGATFIFDYVDKISDSYHKTSSKRCGTYAEFSYWMKNEIILPVHITLIKIVLSTR